MIKMIDRMMMIITMSLMMVYLYALNSHEVNRCVPFDLSLDLIIYYLLLLLLFYYYYYVCYIVHPLRNVCPQSIINWILSS
jgi:hypothetical protein